MNKFIPYEKLSKKKKRALDSAKRGSWHGVNPVTKRVESKKAYHRKKALKWKDDPFQGFLLRLRAAPFRSGDQPIWKSARSRAHRPASASFKNVHSLAKNEAFSF